MLVNVVFNDVDMDLDVLNVPEHLAKDIENIHQMFVDWLYNEDNKHNYRVCIDGIEGYSYGIEVFIEWINNNLIDSTDEKVIIISQHLNELDNKNPTIYF